MKYANIVELAVKVNSYVSFQDNKNLASDLLQLYILHLSTTRYFLRCQIMHWITCATGSYTIPFLAIGRRLPWTCLEHSLQFG